MNTIISESHLSKFDVQKYSHKNGFVYDTSGLPRPLFSIALITEGEGEIFDYDSLSARTARAGDLLFIPMYTKYRSTWHGNPRASYISVHFNFTDKSYFNASRFFSIHTITPKNPERVGELFARLMCETDCVTKKFRVLSAFYELMEILSDSTKSCSAKDKKIMSTLRYIQQNYSKKILVEDLAANVNMSLPRFFPYFKSRVGKTPTEYLNSYRIEQACMLLTENVDMLIDEVSSRVGFESAAYFRRVFKKTVKMTPKEYRKNPNSFHANL